MRLSDLQKYILLKCYESKTGRISRERLKYFYDDKKQKPKNELMTKIITRSIERLIDKEMLVGFGERTKYKWFIKEIKLTSRGKKQGKKLLGEQMKLPFKK
jgi:hypothetical protein